MLLLFSFLTAHVRYRFNVGCQSIVTLSEFDTKRCEKLLAQFIERRRPPPNIRAELNLAFRINGQSVEIFEVRSPFERQRQEAGTLHRQGDVQQDQT
jgi:hypothetical protein